MQQLKIWIVIKQSTNLELNELVLEWEWMWKSSHTHNNKYRLQNSQKEANNQTSNQNNVLCPSKVPSLQILGLGWSQVEDTHSAINKLKRDSLRLVNLIENAQRHFQRLLAWFLRIYTLHCTFYCFDNQNNQCEVWLSFIKYLISLRKMYSMFQQISNLFLKRKIYFDDKKTTNCCS